MPYSMHKQLDISFIYPAPYEDEEGTQPTQPSYPSSSVVVKLRSKVMPHNLVETLLKKSENMIKKLAMAEGGGQP